jgi:hypothetical protein
MSFYNYSVYYSVYKTNTIVEEFTRRYVKNQEDAKTYLKDVFKKTPDIIRRLVLDKIRDIYLGIEI